MSDFGNKGAAVIVTFVSGAMKERGRCSLALAGGSSPRPVYQALSRPPFFAAMPWQDLEIFFGDERAVPPDDPASNYRMACEELLDHVPIPRHNIHRMEAERPDRDAAAREYEALLPDRLDVLLLGMGADGHTASLFPHSAALSERVRTVLPVTGPNPPHDRLTITPPVISAAHATIVLIAGEDKVETLLRVTMGPRDPTRFPIQYVTGGVWLFDEKLSQAHVLAMRAQQPGQGIH